MILSNSRYADCAFLDHRRVGAGTGDPLSWPAWQACQPGGWKQGHRRVPAAGLGQVGHERNATGLDHAGRSRHCLLLIVARSLLAKGFHYINSDFLIASIS
jgi:hypothetical protein